MGVLRLVLVGLVIAAWGASATVWLTSGRPFDPWIHMMFAAVATALFGPDIWRRRDGRKSP